MKECIILRGMKVAVLGAGCAGLCAAKNSLEAGLNVVVYEQTDQVGGTWVCREEVGKDKFGLDVHSAMYQGVKTNLPREVMGYPDFPMTEGNRSFIDSEDVLKFYNRYAEFFNLKTSIKFHHSVLRVSPKGKSQWQIVVKDLNYNRTATKIFDAVFICNGHNFSPLIPQYPGQEVFRGVQFHSHDYRHGAIFRGQRVLVVGAGASAVDVVTDASKMADFVVQSHHWKKNQNIFATVSLVQKYPEISHLTENGVVFKNGTEDTFTMIVYCTGYRYSFPFLTPDCGVTYDQNYVTPLYQHCININRPTMAFIGLCQFVMASQVADMQARFALKFITGAKDLPSREKMLASEEYEIIRRRQVGLCLRRVHLLGPFQEDYLHDLAAIADIKPIDPVIFGIYSAAVATFEKYKLDLRKFNFRIIDEYSFEKSLLP